MNMIGKLILFWIANQSNKWTNLHTKDKVCKGVVEKVQATFMHPILSFGIEKIIKSSGQHNV